MTTQTPPQTYDEMTLEERRDRYAKRRALYGSGRSCGECGMDGTNVVHDPPAYRAIDPYHREFPDVPYHPFVEDERLMVSSSVIGRLITVWEFEAEIGRTIEGKAAYRTCATMLRALLDEMGEQRP